MCWVRPALQVLQRVTLLLLAAIAVMTVRKGLESLSSANPSVDQAVAAIPRAISKITALKTRWPGRLACAMIGAFRQLCIV